MKLKTYIINLKRDHLRKEYVKSIVDPIPILDVEFVEAVDGSSIQNIDACFNQENAIKRYGRTLSRGEIGCTLSHRKCYNKLLQSTEDFVLILEDDILISDSFQQDLENVVPFLNNEKPQIVLLSGGYWYKRTSSKINNDFKLVSIYNAYFTHSYVVNRKAAEYITKNDRDILADDWLEIHKAGVDILAVKPFIVAQQWDGTLPSSISDSLVRPINKKNMSVFFLFQHYVKAVTEKFLFTIGHYVKY